MEFASGWTNKEAAQREAKFWRKHGIKAKIVKQPGHSTAWNVWISREDWDAAVSIGRRYGRS